jgi:hypothetical protein
MKAMAAAADNSEVFDNKTSLNAQRVVTSMIGRTVIHA